MGKLFLGNVHSLLLQFVHRSCQFQRIPENDGRDHQIEPLCASLLLRMRTILDSSMPIEKDGACQGIAGFSFVQPNLDTSAQFHAPLFYRREQREWAAIYVRGLLTADVPRKNVEAMALRLLGAGPHAEQQVRVLQQFLW